MRKFLNSIYDAAPSRRLVLFVSFVTIVIIVDANTFLYIKELFPSFPIIHVNLKPPPGIHAINASYTHTITHPSPLSRDNKNYTCRVNTTSTIKALYN